MSSNYQTKKENKIRQWLMIEFTQQDKVGSVKSYNQLKDIG